jgi:hypothetical protein
MIGTKYYRVSAPQVGRVPNLHLAVVDPQIDRRGGTAGDGYPIEPGEPEMGSPMAAHVGLAPDAGEGRATTPRGPGRCRGEGPGQQTGEDQKRVGRVEGRLTWVQ